MKEQETICVAYTGEAVNDGTMDINDLAPALLALSNFIGEANRILNNDTSTVEVRISAHFERGSFEMVLNLVRNLTQQIKSLFGEQGYSLRQLLNELGLASTLSGINFLELCRRLKGKQPEKVEKVSDDKVRVIFEKESFEVSIGTWRIYKSKKLKNHIEGVLHPLKKPGVDSVEFRDAENKNVVERIADGEAEYFSPPAQEDELQEYVSEQDLMLKILNVNFERGLKWRFDDGDTKFYAEVKDEKFLDAIEAGRLSFGSGDGIYATVETRQQLVQGDIVKTTKSVTKVMRIKRRAEQIDFAE